ncbi:B12-binding domain-containing radical SAM protein [Candidatus Omnitrophota bacterium]
MNILFVYSSDDVQSQTKLLMTQQQMQFGISYISAFLKKHGHQTELLVLSKLLDRDKKSKMIDEYIMRFCPGLICFTCVSTEYSFIVDVAKYIKRNYRNIYLLVGGPHVSLNPEKVLFDDFDALCVGEGENATLELVLQLENGCVPRGIANLWIQNGLAVEKNSTRPFIQELEKVPFPDREMWQKWIKDKAVSFSVLISRGCPFKCTYCCNHVLGELASGPYVRHRAPANIVGEIREIMNRFPEAEEIYFEGETITTMGVERIKELCFKLKALNKTLSRPLSFGTNVRVIPDYNFKKLFTALKESNFRFVNVGLESGSERVRREILGRHYSNRDIINAVATAREYGLQVALFNMIGVPGETMADFKKTVELNRECSPDWHMTSIFFPYPGTKLFSLCEKQGLLDKSIDTDLERRRAICDFSEFKKNKIQKSYTWFDYYVYRGLKPMYKILAHVLRAKLSSNRYFSYYYRTLMRLSFFEWFKEMAQKY